MSTRKGLGYRTGALLVVIVIAGSAACGSEDRRPAEGSGYEPPLMAIPPRALEKCRSGEPLKPVCPIKVPRIKPGTFHFSTAPKADWPIFSAEWGAPTPGISQRNAPPRFAHLVVHGPRRSMFPFELPSELHPGSSGIKDKRRHALLLDSPTWADREGMLVLAPTYPFGGIDGDHLIFRWEEAGENYAVSLHAWRPLSEPIATLRAVVASIPSAGS
jgi:hypothetical protein